MREETDNVYVQARMKLIPEASGLAAERAFRLHQEAKKKGPIPRHLVDRQFHLAMTELCVREGLISEGCMVLSLAKNLPSGVGRLNNPRKKEGR